MSLIPALVPELLKFFRLNRVKKLFRLFLETAPVYKKLNRLISKTGFRVTGFLLYASLFDQYIPCWATTVSYKIFMTPGTHVVLQMILFPG